jgi:Arm DNA-binding domain
MVLTDTAIRETKPRQKRFKMFDRDGLFLLVNPGGSKLWRWRYRFDSKEKLMALGEYPLVNLEQARDFTSQFARRWLPALIRWPNARQKPRPNSAKQKTALRR